MFDLHFLVSSLYEDLSPTTELNRFLHLHRKGNHIPHSNSLNQITSSGDMSGIMIREARL